MQQTFKWIPTRDSTCCWPQLLGRRVCWERENSNEQQSTSYSILFGIKFIDQQANIHERDRARSVDGWQHNERRNGNDN
jgi:hypothetical protein